MRDEDRPPPEIWMNPTAINDHFSRLKEKYASGSTTGETDEVVDLDQNELTRGLR